MSRIWMGGKLDLSPMFGEEAELGLGVYPEGALYSKVRCIISNGHIRTPCPTVLIISKESAANLLNANGLLSNPEVLIMGKNIWARIVRVS